LYEKAGFKKYAIKKDFYLRLYPDPIIENGVQLRDMVMLKKVL
jgi:ribosomal protein S18 acetylase RimI-like enzyme